ncbi:hypothetical protein ABZP36_034589 [Zizania latifolia]
MERYECLGKIGDGAAGVVHKARDRRTGETVAVKRLRGGIIAGGYGGDADEEFLREVRCLEACLGHPSLVELRAAHRENGAAYYIVMESEMDQLNRVFDTVGMQDMRSWPGFARLPRAESALCHRARPPSRLREKFPTLSAAGFDVLCGLLACRPDMRLSASEALRCPWFTEADAPDAMPAACGGACFTPCVSGVADAIVV